MHPSMTAQGWRKRQISDQVDADARITILEEENVDLKALLMHCHYYVTHFGTTNTIRTETIVTATLEMMMG